jgi:XTP/dITP diphosphohydrolase
MWAWDLAIMSRKFIEKNLVLATHNQGKINEIKNILSSLSIKIITAKELGLIEPNEDGHTYLENALIKARACAQSSGMLSLSDDAGVEVEALGNNPGVHTAPFTKEMGGREKVFALWREDERIKHNPNVRFVSVNVLAWPDGHYEFSEGIVSGKLVFPPRGENGFGYDPTFMPDGSNKTMAEMSGEEKNRYSHRFLALKGLFKL